MIYEPTIAPKVAFSFTQKTFVCLYYTVVCLVGYCSKNKNIPIMMDRIRTNDRVVQDVTTLPTVPPKFIYNPESESQYLSCQDKMNAKRDMGPFLYEWPRFRKVLQHCVGLHLELNKHALAR